MSPEFLPHFFLLIAGVFLAGFALHRLQSKRWGSALKLGGLGLALIGIAVLGGRYASWKSEQSWRTRATELSPPLVPADSSKSSPLEAAAMTLILGGVQFRVQASNQYEFSARDEVFLTVNSDSAGLLVSCGAAGAASTPEPPHFWRPSRELGARIHENMLTYTASGVRSSRPDPHTILVEERGTEILRVHFREPRVLEIDGQMYLPSGSLRLERGIAWPGSYIPPGPIDLTARGRGRIDLEPSGTVRVVSR